jgi:hypothetical protein
MSIVAIILIVIVVVAVAVAASLVLQRRALQRRFGPEYDRLAAEVGPRRAREELARRSRIVEQLEIRPLSPRERENYDGRWEAVQEQFVDSPAEATRRAQTLITTVARDVGYSADDEEKLFTELSVNHARALDGYRHGKDTSSQPTGQSTEGLRQTLLEYRVLFRELLGEPDDAAAADPADPAEPGLVPADVTANVTKE